LHDERDSREKSGKPGKKMDPKLYLLFALYSAIVASASTKKPREYIRKLRFSRLLKGRMASQS
jgi:hypothetical protein